jgi:hypothetical protein
MNFKNGRWSGRNKLIPVFTMNFSMEKPPIHNYYELPNLYLIEIMFPAKRRKKSSTGIGQRQYVVINKNDLTAHFFRLKNDFFGGISAQVNFQHGMFINNIPAITFKRQIELALNQPINSNMGAKEKLQELFNNIDEEDNNLIIFGRLK